MLLGIFPSLLNRPPRFCTGPLRVGALESELEEDARREYNSGGETEESDESEDEEVRWQGGGRTQDPSKLKTTRPKQIARSLTDVLPWPLLESFPRVELRVRCRSLHFPSSRLYRSLQCNAFQSESSEEQEDDIVLTPEPLETLTKPVR